MKLNNKGFAISSIMYLILVMALLLVAILLGLLNSRKNILDTQKRKLINSLAVEPLESLTVFNYSNDDIFTVPKGGVYKFELCGSKESNVNGTCTYGLINIDKGITFYISFSNYASVNYLGNSIMFASGGISKYMNNDCNGSFISGDINCNYNNTGAPVHPDYVFSNTEIKENINSGNAYAKITYIGS